MTKQEAIEILTEMRDWNDYITQSDALQMAIDALEQKPCTDAISRQAVMDGLEKYHNTDMNIDGLTYAYDLVCKLPSVSYSEKPNRCGDAISRQAALDAMCDASIPIVYKGKPSFVVNYVGVIAKLPSVSMEKLDKAKSEIRCGENKAYNADFTMGCEYAIGVIERAFEEVEE